MRRVVKKGGVVGVVAADDDGNLMEPREPILEHSKKLVSRLYEHDGKHRFIGKHLRALLHQGGFSRVEASARYVYNLGGGGESARWWGGRAAPLLLGSMGQRIIDLGWADRETLEKTVGAWRAWGENPDAFHARCMCDAVGWAE